MNNPETWRKRKSVLNVPYENVANYMTFDALDYSWIVFLLAAEGITYDRDWWQ